jgi:hypothetical protein
MVIVLRHANEGIHGTDTPNTKAQRLAGSRTGECREMQRGGQRGEDTNQRKLASATYKDSPKWVNSVLGAMKMRN